MRLPAREQGNWRSLLRVRAERAKRAYHQFLASGHIAPPPGGACGPPWSTTMPLLNMILLVEVLSGVHRSGGQNPIQAFELRIGNRPRHRADAGIASPEFPCHKFDEFGVGDFFRSPERAGRSTDSGKPLTASVPAIPPGCPMQRLRRHAWTTTYKALTELATRPGDPRRRDKDGGTLATIAKSYGRRHQPG